MKMSKEPIKYGGDLLQVSVQNELMRSKLIIEYPDYYEEDYQMPMLRANSFRYLLKTQWDGIGNVTRFSYDISGRVSLQSMYEKQKISYAELREFLRQFLEMTEELKKYMLRPEHLWLQPEHIFQNEGQYQFCYVPVIHLSLQEQFHRLTEFFVSQIDYEDMECVFLAHKLNRETMAEQFDIMTILKQYELEASERETEKTEEKEKEREKKERMEKVLENKAEEPDLPEYSVCEKAEAIRERGKFGGFLGSTVRRRKKKRWGKWQDLILESDGQDSGSIL